MESRQCCQPRQSVLDGSEDFVVNLSALPELSAAEAAEFLDANVLTSGMEDLITQSFDRLSGGPSRGIFKLSEAMGGDQRLLRHPCRLVAGMGRGNLTAPLRAEPAGGRRVFRHGLHSLRRRRTRLRRVCLRSQSGRLPAHLGRAQHHRRPAGIPCPSARRPAGNPPELGGKHAISGADRKRSAPASFQRTREEEEQL